MLTTDQKGAVAELAIAQAAAGLGIGVYRPLTDGERYDLIFDLRPRLLGVQCKWATPCGGAVVVRCYSCRRDPKQMIVRRYTSAEVDAIAAYCARTNACYLLPPDLFCGRRQVHLRVAACRNNQQLGINWAKDFAFEAKLGALVGP
jgi:PD-(D/E)XK nuclease superfamily protein